MLRNCSGVGRLLGSGPSWVVHRPGATDWARMQMQISERLGQASCVPHALPPTQLCPCPARKGEAAPGYARNAAGSRMQQEERAACCPESGQRTHCQGEEGLPLLSFLIPGSPSSWAAQEPGGTGQLLRGCLNPAASAQHLPFPRGARAGGGNCWMPVGSSHCQELKPLFKDVAWNPRASAPGQLSEAGRQRMGYQAASQWGEQ